MRFRTFRISITCSFVMRAAVFGALPFLIPLMLQIGYGLTPLQSGYLTFVGSIGSLAVKFLLEALLKRTGFRGLLVATALVGGGLAASLAIADPVASPSLFMLVVFLSSFARILHILALESVVFAEIPSSDVGQASTLLSVMKQLAASVGVAYAAAILGGLQWSRQGDPGLLDFRIALLFAAITMSLTLFLNLKLRRDDGEEISGKRK